jgi:hypothetical protein
MPGASRVPALVDGGRLKGGFPRAVWLILAADPSLMGAEAAAGHLIRLGRPCHLVWNPMTGEMAQMIPVTRAARSLAWPDSPGWLNGPGWLETPDSPPGPPVMGSKPGSPREVVIPAAPDGLAAVNNEGRVCVQVAVIGFAWEPFTEGPAAGLSDIAAWLDSWHVPRSWPAGRPAAFPAARLATRSRRTWARGGHFGASQVPGSTSMGPGAITVERVTGAPTRPHVPPIAPPPRTGTAPLARPMPRVDPGERPEPSDSRRLIRIPASLP